MTNQQLLFDTITQKLPTNQNLATVVSELLNISADSAYRRIRGETELTFGEAEKLCGHFHISIDALQHLYSENVLFSYLPMKEPESYLNYRQNILDFVQRVANCKNREVLMLLTDIPYAHYVMFPDLRLFKYYSWIMNSRKVIVAYEKFMEQFNVEEHHYFCTAAANAYRKIPSKEIWTNFTILPLVEMLSYHRDIRSFVQKDTFLSLCNSVLNLIENLEQFTVNQTKDYTGEQTPFELYLYPSSVISDIILYKADDQLRVRLKFTDMNAVHTSNPQFCKEIETYIRHIISKSYLLSGSSQRERILFFNEMKDRVWRLKNGGE